MSDDANTNLAAIRLLLIQNQSRDEEFQINLLNALNGVTAGISSLFGQLEFIAGYTGDTRERLNGVILLLDESKALQAQIRDKTTEAANTLDVFNTNTTTNFRTLLDFLDLMNGNAATNARYIAAAACGDCPDGPPPPPPDPSGYEYCSVPTDRTVTIPASGQYITPWSWSILPGGSTSVPVGGAFYFNLYGTTPSGVSVALGKFDSGGALIEPYFIKSAGDAAYEGTRASGVPTTKLIIQGTPNTVVTVSYKWCGNTVVSS